MRRTLTITMCVETDADPRALERAFEAMISDETVSDTLLEGETFRSLTFGFDVTDDEPDSERTQRADHLMEQAKDARERGEGA